MTIMSSRSLSSRPSWWVWAWVAVMMSLVLFMIRLAILQAFMENPMDTAEWRASKARWEMAAARHRQAFNMPPKEDDAKMLKLWEIKLMIDAAVARNKAKIRRRR